MLEKNIALAFFHKGEYANALVYFERVLKRLGVKSPENKILIVIKLVFDFLKIIQNLYFPSKKTRKIADNRDNEIFDLSEKKDITLVYLNPMRSFCEAIGLIKRSLEFDLKRIKNGYLMPLSGSGNSSFAGFFRLSKKFLDFAEGVVDKKNYKQLLAFNLYKTQHDCFSGNWDDIRDYDQSLLEHNLKIGQFWEVSNYIMFCGFAKLQQGKFKAVYPLIEELSRIADNYEYEIARLNRSFMETELFFKCRKLNEAQKSAQELESCSNRIGIELSQITPIGYAALIQILLKDLAGAEKSLNQAGKLYKQEAILPPVISAPYLYGKFSLDIEFLAESILSNNKASISKNVKNAYKSGKNALKNAKKYALHRSELLRLMGLYCWLINKQNKAVIWWNRAMEEGRRLGADPDLARTYMEIGKRFLEDKSKHDELNGVNAREYLEKARTMFQEMDLQWDLNELETIAA